MDKYIFNCPSCETSNLNMKISFKEINEIKTGVLVGDKIIQYIICPHCNYALAGLRNTRYSDDENEIELKILKLYTHIGRDSYINHEYDELITKAKLSVDDKLRYHKDMINKLEKVEFTHEY